jgi:hypothetical protein
MVYRFAQEREDYSDFAAGKVFHGLAGHPAFPVRLASEIFQRCVAIRAAEQLTGPCVVYDPCCGGSYLLSTLAYLHWKDISRVLASDINTEALKTAEFNLALLTEAGLAQRIVHINRLIALYGKGSHREALVSAQRLRSRLVQQNADHILTTRLFKADVLKPDELISNLAGEHLDVVIADIPYGSHSFWHMLQSLSDVLSSHSVVAICADKRQKVAHERYRRLERFQVGKHRILILHPELP